MTKLATVAMHRDPHDKDLNFSKMVSFVEEAAEKGVDLLVFPEECLTGFGTVPMNVFSPDDRMIHLAHAELVPEGPSTQAFAELAKKHDMYICWGMAEKDESRFDVTYNCAVFVGPEGYIGKYRKTHLPLAECLTHHPGRGDYPVFDTRFGKVGIEICFDKCFPEVARCLAVEGALIVLSPTAWPGDLETDRRIYDTLSAARAAESMIFFIDSNHCGEIMPGCGSFMYGNSQVISPIAGQVLATTGSNEGIAIADVDIESEIVRARTYSMGGGDLLRERKPATYGPLTAFSKYSVNQGTSE